MIKDNKEDILLSIYLLKKKFNEELESLRKSKSSETTAIQNKITDLEKNILNLDVVIENKFNEFINSIDFPTNGVDGRNGKPGKDGLDGKDGRDGIDGQNGLDGRDGKDGILLVDSGGNPFLSTIGSYNVQIVTSQPVQAIGYDTGGGSSISTQQIRDAMALALSIGIIPQSGSIDEKTKTSADQATIAAINVQA